MVVAVQLLAYIALASSAAYGAPTNHQQPQTKFDGFEIQITSRDFDVNGLYFTGLIEQLEDFDLALLSSNRFHIEPPVLARETQAATAVTPGLVANPQQQLSFQSRSLEQYMRDVMRNSQGPPSMASKMRGGIDKEEDSMAEDYEEEDDSYETITFDFEVYPDNILSYNGKDMYQICRHWFESNKYAILLPHVDDEFEKRDVEEDIEAGEVDENEEDDDEEYDYDWPQEEGEFASPENWTCYMLEGRLSAVVTEFEDIPVV